MEGSISEAWSQDPAVPIPFELTVKGKLAAAAPLPELEPGTCPNSSDDPRNPCPACAWAAQDA